MALSRTYNKTIINKEKFTNQVSSFDNYSHWSSFGTQLTVYLTSDFTTQQETDLDNLIANWIDYSTAESLVVYLDTSVFPFTKMLINKFAAENIAMGITQANKSGDLLSLFERPYPTASLGGSLSLKGCFDTGSLYEAVKIIQHIRDNSTEYDNMSPFVTDARLLSLKNEIEVFLGVTPTT